MYYREKETYSKVIYEDGSILPTFFQHHWQRYTVISITTVQYLNTDSQFEMFK